MPSKATWALLRCHCCIETQGQGVVMNCSWWRVCCWLHQQLPLLGLQVPISLSLSLAQEMLSVLAESAAHLSYKGPILLAA